MKESKNTELKTFDYVRLVDGTIGRVCHSHIGNGSYNIDCNNYTRHIEVCEVIKKSENLIDLVRVGDYVNGIKITHILENPEIVDEKGNTIIKLYDDFNKNIRNELGDILFEKDIKSIVTKEQFKSVEYEVNNE